jgi:hypothetical protein
MEAGGGGGVGVRVYQLKLSLGNRKYKKAKSVSHVAAERNGIDESRNGAVCFRKDSRYDAVTHSQLRHFHWAFSQNLGLLVTQSIVQCIL